MLEFNWVFGWRKLSTNIPKKNKYRSKLPKCLLKLIVTTIVSTWVIVITCYCQLTWIPGTITLFMIFLKILSISTTNSNELYNTLKIKFKKKLIFFHVFLCSPLKMEWSHVVYVPLNSILLRFMDKRNKNKCSGCNIFFIFFFLLFFHNFHAIWVK